MKKKEISSLINQYLNGETTPQEENWIEGSYNQLAKRKNISSVPIEPIE